MNITAHFKHASLRIDDFIEIAFFKNMSGIIVLRVVIVCVAFINEGHYFGDGLLARTELEMKVVVHQTVGGKLKRDFSVYRLQDI